MTAPSRFGAALIAVLQLNCGAGRMPDPLPPASYPARTRPELTGIDYRVRLDSGLQTLEVRACFHGSPPPELVAGLRGGGGLLRGALAEMPTTTRALSIAEDRIELGELPASACIRYQIDLRAAEVDHHFGAVRRGQAAAINAAVWLWRPLHWQRLRDLRVQFELPAGMRVSTPWPAQGGGYRLDLSALAFHSFAAFGRFETERIEAPSASLEVAVLDGLSPKTRASVVPWLTAAAQMAALPFGRFPRARAHVVVVPMPSSSEVVPFGTSTRGGGASALLLLSSDAERDPMLHDWVAVHEFCHLLHPFTQRAQAWLPEGIATYYQEVLRVRAGYESEATAWRRLQEGAALGRTSPRSLVEESADMFRDGSFKLVYWAGAAFALLSDAELRRSTGGRLSLDAALRQLSEQQTTLQLEPLRAEEVIERLDRIAGAPLLSRLLQRWVQSPGLPDLDPLYARMGLHREAGEVQIANAAPEAWIRAAIMRRTELGPSADARSLLPGMSVEYAAHIHIAHHIDHGPAAVEEPIDRKQ